MWHGHLFFAYTTKKRKGRRGKGKRGGGKGRGRGEEGEKGGGRGEGEEEKFFSPPTARTSSRIMRKLPSPSFSYVPKSAISPLKGTAMESSTTAVNKGKPQGNPGRNQQEAGAMGGDLDTKVKCRPACFSASARVARWPAPSKSRAGRSRTALAHVFAPHIRDPVGCVLCTLRHCATTSRAFPMQPAVTKLDTKLTNSSILESPSKRGSPHRSRRFLSSAPRRDDDDARTGRARPVRHARWRWCWEERGTRLLSVARFDTHRAHSLIAAHPSQ